jgi:hypothetical protein
LQTEGRQQFRINRQVILVIVVCLLALALPLAGVILTLQELTKSGKSRASHESGSDVSDALQSRLEGIADRKLVPEEGLGGNFGIELTTGQVRGERERIEGLLKSYGGIAIPTFESETEIRLLVRVPVEHVGEFLASCRPGKEAGVVRDPSGGLLEVVIKRADSQ